MFFFFNDTATTEIYTLSLHDALPIYEAAVEEAHPPVVEQQVVARVRVARGAAQLVEGAEVEAEDDLAEADRKSTRLNSSHANISYAVFCLKKKTPVATRPMMRGGHAR